MLLSLSLVSLVSVGVEIIRDGEIDPVYNPVSGPLAHAAGYAKELPGCILGEKTFLSGVRTPEPPHGSGDCLDRPQAVTWTYSPSRVVAHLVID